MLLSEYEDILQTDDIDIESMNQSEQILDIQNSDEQKIDSNGQFDKKSQMFDEKYSLQRNSIPNKWSNSIQNANWNNPQRKTPHQKSSSSSDFSMDKNNHLINNVFDPTSFKRNAPKYNLQDIPKLYQTPWSDKDWATPKENLLGEKADDVISGNNLKTLIILSFFTFLQVGGWKKLHNESSTLRIRQLVGIIFSLLFFVEEIDEDSCDEDEISQEQQNEINTKNTASQIVNSNLSNTPTTINRFEIKYNILVTTKTNLNSFKTL